VAIPIAFSLTTPLEGFATASRAGSPFLSLSPSQSSVIGFTGLPIRLNPSRIY